MSIFRWIPSKEQALRALTFTGTTQEELDLWIEEITPRIQRHLQKLGRKKMPPLAAYGLLVMIGNAATDLFEEGLTVSAETVLNRWQSDILKRKGF